MVSIPGQYIGLYKDITAYAFINIRLRSFISKQGYLQNVAVAVGIQVPSATTVRHCAPYINSKKDSEVTASMALENIRIRIELWARPALTDSYQLAFLVFVLHQMKI